MTPTDDHIRAYRYHIESGMCDPCASVSAWPERMSLLVTICNSTKCLRLMDAAEVPAWVHRVSRPVPVGTKTVRVKCVICSKRFAAKRSSAKYCGDRCRRRASWKVTA